MRSLNTERVKIDALKGSRLQRGEPDFSVPWSKWGNDDEDEGS